jgi:hypothetical protein
MNYLKKTGFFAVLLGIFVFGTFQPCHAKAIPATEIQFGGITVLTTLEQVTAIYGEPTTKREYVSTKDRRGNYNVSSDLNKLKGALASGDIGHFVEYVYGSGNNQLVITAVAPSNRYTKGNIPSQIHNKKLKIATASITANNLKTPAGISVGSTLDQVEKAYGKSSHISSHNNELTYFYDGRGIHFYIIFKNGKVIKMTLSGLM